MSFTALTNDSSMLSARVQCARHGVQDTTERVCYWILLRTRTTKICDIGILVSGSYDLVERSEKLGCRSSLFCFARFESEWRFIGPVCTLKSKAARGYCSSEDGMSLAKDIATCPCRRHLRQTISSLGWKILNTIGGGCKLGALGQKMAWKRTGSALRCQYTLIFARTWETCRTWPSGNCRTYHTVFSNHSFKSITAAT